MKNVNEVQQMDDLDIRRVGPYTQKASSLPNNYRLYLFVVPAVLYYVLFHKVPLDGIQMPSKKYIPFKVIADSPWVGFEHFE